MTPIFQDIIAGGTILFVIFTIFGYLNYRINKMRSIAMCDVLHGQTNDRLEEGEKKFEKLEIKIDAQTTLIANIDKNVAVLAEKAKKGE